MLQETKVRHGEQIKCGAVDDFQVFYLNRQESQGGGLALGVLKTIESALIRDSDDDIEVLSVYAITFKG